MRGLVVVMACGRVGFEHAAVAHDSGAGADVPIADESRTTRYRSARRVASPRTSSDGITFMQRAQLPGVFTVASCQVALGAGTYTEVVNGGRARFEGIAVVGP